MKQNDGGSAKPDERSVRAKWLEETGGPAFPIPVAGCTDGGVYNTMEQSGGQLGGMTLRDWFATHAPEPPEWWLQTQRQHDHNRNPHNEDHKPPIRSDAEIDAAWRWTWADAMLAERERGDG